MIGRVGSSSPSASVICEEVFDEGYLPSAEEINDYATKLGIDPVKEPHLLYLAREGLMQALPSDWKICYSEEQDAHYYYNIKTKHSQWDHPLDADYRELAEQARQKIFSSAITPVIDNSDDASQLDSGIRSLQGNEDMDSNNTNDISSPLKDSAKCSSSNGTLSFTGTSGFSGGVNRFLESRTKCFPVASNFPTVKMSRFEVTKTNPQIGLSMKLNNSDGQQSLQHIPLTPSGDGTELKKGFTISGTGAMFLKSNVRKNLELHNLVETKEKSSTVGLFAEISNTGVKGILRDSSLTDMRRKGDSLENEGGEDKKSVRFNLEDVKSRTNLSPEEDYSSSKKLTQSPEISVTSDDEYNWENNDEECDEEFDEAGKHVKEVKVMPVSRPGKVPILRAQSFSLDVTDKDRSRLSDATRSLSVESQPSSTVSLLEKLKETTHVKPLYEDTDSESKASSVRSFVNKSEQEFESIPFDLDELDKKHERDVEELENKIKGGAIRKVAQFPVIPEISSRYVTVSDQIDKEVENEIQKYRQQREADKIEIIQKEKERLDERLQHDIETIKKENDIKLKNLRHEHDLRLTSVRHQLEEEFEKHFADYRAEMEIDLDIKRKAVVDEHKKHMSTLQKNHSEIFQDLERDLKSEEEILKKEHSTKLLEMRDKLAHEIELERQKMRDTGEDRLYEKVRCEKRLLEDKYRCLKEKYVRLKTDVKLSLERRNRRREQQAVLNQQSLNNTTTGSETERSMSNKPSIGNSENRSLSISASGIKPPIPPKTHLHNVREHPLREKSAERQQPRKPGITSKYIKHLQIHDDTTSMSQSDTTISNNYPKGRYLPSPILSDNGNSDSEALQNNQENNNNTRGAGSQRKKFFSRMKSASTSRLNSDIFKGDRPCTPVENLRHQLQKLEDLEDQFPDNTLDATYHLRYPFSDVSNEHAGTSSAELEFFKHRIHLERDSVRRAKESLRTQRTNFRARQREIKQHHKINSTRHSLDQLIQEEKELTEMEVNLHRTRALLGEKVIRLRHLEHSLQRIFEKEKPMDFLSVENKDDATLSDLSSHSSSGFSSTDFASVDTHNLNRRKDMYHQESSECIQNLEILNVEIREILDILSKQQGHGASIPLSSPQNDFNWANLLSSPGAVSGTSNGSTLLHAPQSIPTLADRLETYRQLATGRMGGAILAANTIVSQSPRAVNYTTSLVERTRDLRNWLRQAKNEHEILTGGAASSVGAVTTTAAPALGGHSVTGGHPHTNL
ncbi:golgin subfamily B member 1 [Episyrphus balteatus]|uniref:golgin subfamily B member 1 n=1 Tax=Episyrphus balteatus TaxID=286459 RepID=UPI002485BC27|nr:golgin subfamily B member 1 [Episyrphus balteatus]